MWPHVELATYTTPKSATLTLENTGIGPAVVGSIVVSVDGTARRNWPDALEALFGALPKTYSVTTMGDRAMRPGEKTVIVEVPADQLPPGFWQYIGRVGVSICYASVFGEHWTMSVPKLGGKPTWTPNSGCPPQRDSTDF